MLLALFGIILDIEVEAVDYYVTEGSFRFVICFGIRGCGCRGAVEAAVGFPERGGDVFCTCMVGDAPMMTIAAETYEDLDACSSSEA